jgi:transposase
MTGSIRSEVISVVQRRRQWTPAQKASLLMEAEAAGSSIAAVADRHGIRRSLMFEWRRQIRCGTMPGVARALEEQQPVFATVALLDAPEATVAEPARSAVEIVLANGRILRVAEAIGTSVLQRLVVALEA